MKAFASLYAALDETNRTTAKVEALTHYFQKAQPADAAWAVYFLVGRKPKQVVPTRRLAQWAIEVAQIPPWLFEESYHSVGDLAETITLVLPEPPVPDERPLHYWVEERLLPMRGLPEAEQREALLRSWAELDRPQRFVWNKLITGAFRVGVSQSLVIRALAESSGIEVPTIAHRLMGDWQPTQQFFEQLVTIESTDADIGRPYPFYLAHPLDHDPASLGDRGEWQIEWKWDGIRSQLIRRDGQTFLWSRGEELVTERYPEIAAASSMLPDGTVIDGELLPWRDDLVLPFGHLQRRIGRKAVSKKILEEVPVIVMAYDLLEHNGVDIRAEPIERRRALLEEVITNANHPRILLSPICTEARWDELARVRNESRARRVEGMMLKRHGSPYRVGRQRGDWWKWKIDPFTVDAVLIYAQRGSGKRAGLYTDYTFGLWDDGKLVPVAKAYSGLTDEEIRQVDAFVRGHTIEKFGPVRTVRPDLVFELGFEGIQKSTRHKSGVAVRFPRMLRWRTDKKAEEADQLAALQALIPEAPS